MNLTSPEPTPRRTASHQRLRRHAQALATGAFATALGLGGLATVAIGATPANANTGEPVINCSTNPNIVSTCYGTDGKPLANGSDDSNWLVSGGTNNDVDAAGTNYTRDDGFFSGPAPEQRVPAGTVGSVQRPPSDAVFHPAQVGKVADVWQTPSSSSASTWISHNYPTGKTRPNGAAYGTWVNSNNDTYGDWYDKYNFTVAPDVDPAKVALDLRFFAVNSVAQVWANDTPLSPDGTTLQGGTDPYTSANYQNTDTGTTATLLTGHWNTGENSITLQPKSGPRAEGLGVFASSSAVCTTPAATDDTSTNTQGATQTIDVLNNDTSGSDPSNPLDPSTLTLIGKDGTPTDTVTVPGEGTYTVSDSTVVFTPEPDFTGTATPVTYQVSNTSGDPVTATATPTVTPVASPDTTAGPQGKPQTSDVLTNDGTDGNSLDPSALTLIGNDGTPTGTVTIPGEGTYTISNGTIVFTPEPTFTGTATPVTYQATDSDGNPVQSTYTPTVTPAVGPTHTPTSGSGTAQAGTAPAARGRRRLRRPGRR